MGKHTERAPEAYQIIVQVKLVTVLEEDLHSANEFFPESGLQGDQLMVDFAGTSQKLLPSIMQSINLVHLFLGYQKSIFVKQSIRFLHKKKEEKSLPIRQIKQEERVNMTNCCENSSCPPAPCKSS